MKRAILIKSCRKNVDRRHACEMTWRGDLGMAVPVHFVVGGGERPGVHDDCIHVDTDDDYQSNSLKLKAALAKLLSVKDMPEDFRLFVCDDDTFIHPLRWLAHEPAGELECRLHRPNTPLQIQMNDGRPWVNGGAGWYMSRRLCELYVAEVNLSCSWDDILVSQVAARHGIRAIDRPDLYSDSRYGTPSWRINSPVLTCHPVEPAEMRKMYGECNAQVGNNVLS